MISPDEIAKKSERIYGKFLAAWVRGDTDEFFPCRVRASLSLDVNDVRSSLAAAERLWAQSKEMRGWGYTVHRQFVRSRDFGQNQFPQAITIDTRDDLLRLAKKSHEFLAIESVAARIRGEFPQLDEWVRTSIRQLAGLSESLDGLIEVTRYFLAHPNPNCFARQLPVQVDTKFVDRHHTVLRQWLDVLLPSHAIDVNESKFARRFGLRDGQPHRGLRLLDPVLRGELGLPFDELSLPVNAMADLAVEHSTVIIVENDLNLWTLPAYPRGIGIRGEGQAVTRLARVPWLGGNQVLYWGDIDVDGFLILASLRNLVPHVESIMMDRETLRVHQEFVVPGNGARPAMPTNLTVGEMDAFEWCLNSDQRLEQEKILQPYVNQCFRQCRQ